MNKKTNETGFTLIELLLVVVIIGILLAVIVPRAWRANVDAKYGLVRQNATELSSFASQWAEQQIEAQDLDSEATLTNYYQTLANVDVGDGGGAWIASQGTGEGAGADNWTALNDVPGRNIAGEDDEPPEASVQDIIPPERQPRNPFNGANVFVSTNNPWDAGSPIPGAIAFGYQEDAEFYYFGFVFQGTDSTDNVFDGGTDTFHAGQAISPLANLRNGVYAARLAQ